MKRIHFFYPKGERLTGQELASKMIVDLLDDDWEFNLQEIPAYERNPEKKFYLLGYVFRVLKTWFSFFKLIFALKPAIYVNMGQGLASLIRDGLPLILLSWIRWDMRCVISLHGHVFTQWNKKDFTSRLFVRVLKKAEIVTVLGGVQKKKLSGLGIDISKIIILNNTCEIESYKKIDNNSGEINLLYLSNLIKSKGYCEYLESLEFLATQPADFKINAVLCGQVTISGTSDTNETIEESVNWINDKITSINKSSHVNVEWIKGAYGEVKRGLFEQADIFVFPSRYSVEAQPLVLLEAMSMGCAIITSEVGEIPSTVSTDCAVLLADPTPERIAAAINGMKKNGISSFSSQGLKRYEEKFSRKIYRQKWQEIFCRITNTTELGNEAFCNLEKFDNHDFNRGRPAFVEFLWILTRGFFFSLNYLPIYRTRRIILRFFGGEIGKKVVIKPTAKITFPWRLSVGENSWIGEESWMLNLDQITIGSNVVISQRVFLCTGNHNWALPKFDLMLNPIVIENGVWIGSEVTVLPGVRIGANTVVTAGSVVTEDLPPEMVCTGNPCKPVKARKFDN